MYHAARTTTCRLCEYQCYVAGNNALHSIAVDSAWWINAACQATIVNNSRSGAQGISTNVALPAGGCCYETMLLPRTSKQGKEKTLKIVAFGPSALRQQFSMSSLSPVLRYVVIIHCVIIDCFTSVTHNLFSKVFVKCLKMAANTPQLSRFGFCDDQNLILA